jgi:hypothetical protein
MKHRKLTVVAAASALFLTMHLPATAQGFMEDMIIKRIKMLTKIKMVSLAEKRP